MLPNAPPTPLINQQQAIGVIVKHDTHKGTPIHVSSSQHLNILHQHQHQHQQLQQQQQSPPANIVQSKPKVSSPAPAHIYGRPSVIPQGPHPPPAHSSRSIYESSRIFTTPPIKPQQLQQPLSFTIHNSLSSPTNAARPLSRSPGIRVSTSNSTACDTLSFQTQPLDLGVSDRTRVNSTSPKRKTSPLQHPTTLEIKYKVVETPPIIITEHVQTTPLALKVSPHSVNTKQHLVQSETIHIQQNQDEPLKLSDSKLISRSGDELSPSLIVITNSNDSCSSFSSNNNNNNNNSNADCSTNNNENKISVSSSSTNQSIDQLRTSSADGLVRVSSENSSPVPSPNSTQSAPATPAKLQSELEKSSSPGT